MNLYDIAIAKKLSGGGGGGSAVIESLSVTENGTYTAGEGVDGFSPVEVNVPASGGITADDIAMRTISGVVSGSASVISGYAFASCKSITEANFPMASILWSYAFAYCTSLTKVNFPSVRTIAGSAFFSCALSEASFPILSAINGSSAFTSNSSLMKLILLSTSVVSLAKSNLFDNTPISKSTYTGTFGSIYVPASLVDSYKTATNWSYYSNRITAYEG